MIEGHGFKRGDLQGPSIGFEADHPHAALCEVGQDVVRGLEPRAHVKDHFPISHVQESFNGDVEFETDVTQGIVFLHDASVRLVQTSHHPIVLAVVAHGEIHGVVINNAHLTWTIGIGFKKFHDQRQ